MNNLYKYIILYISVAIAALSIFLTLDSLHETNIEFQKHLFEKELQKDVDIEKNSELISEAKQKDLLLKSFSLLILIAVTILIHQQIKNNDELVHEANNKNREIESTKKLLQEILDGNLSFLFVANDNEVIFTNKTVLDFFGFTNIKDFKNKYPNLSDIFEKTDNQDFLQRYIENEHWTEFLKREQEHRNVKVLIKKDGKNRYFKAHTKEIIIDDEILYLIIFDEMTREFQQMQELEESASIDTLTKLFNRRKFNTVLAKEIDLCKSTDSPLSIIFLDIDHFKKINDTYGHDVGDEVLIELSSLLNNKTRKGDFIFRWGGEEFAITLKSANIIQASILAEKIRKDVQSYEFKSVPSQTISLGITQYKENDTQESFIKRVDQALYEAKSSGRNRVVSN